MAFKLKKQEVQEPKKQDQEQTQSMFDTNAPAPTNEPQLRVQEIIPEKAAPKQESEPGTEQAAGEEKPAEKVPYTSEEISRILQEEDGKLDSDRLSPEGKLLLKEFQRGFTPKLMERRELQEKVKELEEKVNQPTQPQGFNPYEAYAQDPIGMTRDLNALILSKEQELDNVDPYNNELREQVRGQLNFFKGLKNDLELSRLQTEKQYYESEEAVDSTLEQVIQEIPDFAAKVDSLKKFAIEKMGYSEDKIDRITDPTINDPEMVVENIKIINKEYERDLAASKLKDKQKKQEPTNLLQSEGGTVNHSGSGSQDINDPKNPPSDMRAYKAWRAKWHPEMVRQFG